MEIGSYIDGRPLTYVEATDSLAIGGSPISFTQLSQYDAAGQIRWVSQQWRDWGLSRARSSAAPVPAGTVVTPESTKVTGRRVGAFLLDIIFVNLIQLPLAVPLAMVATSDAEIDAMSRLIGLVVGCGYFVICEAAWGRTLGKAALGLRVVNLSGHHITLGQSLGRNAARYIDLLFFAIPAFAAMSSSPIHERLGDKWAKTAVVRM